MVEYDASIFFGFPLAARTQSGSCQRETNSNQRRGSTYCFVATIVIVYSLRWLIEGIQQSTWPWAPFQKVRFLVLCSWEHEPQCTTITTEFLIAAALCVRLSTFCPPYCFTIDPSPGVFSERGRRCAHGDHERPSVPRVASRKWQLYRPGRRQDRHRKCMETCMDRRIYVLIREGGGYPVVAIRNHGGPQHHVCPYMFSRHVWTSLLC